MPNPRIKEHAADGGHAKAAKAQEALMARVASLPVGELPFATEEDWQRALAQVAKWTLPPLCVLPHGHATAIAKLAAEWRNFEAQRLDRERIKVMERRISELEGELRQARARATMVA